MYMWLIPRVHELLLVCCSVYIPHGFFGIQSQNWLGYIEMQSHTVTPVRLERGKLQCPPYLHHLLSEDSCQSGWWMTARLWRFLAQTQSCSFSLPLWNASQNFDIWKSQSHHQLTHMLGDDKRFQWEQTGMVIPCGLVVRIRRSHRRGRGSIPRMGDYKFFFSFSFSFPFFFTSSFSSHIFKLQPSFPFHDWQKNGRMYKIESSIFASLVWYQQLIIAPIPITAPCKSHLFDSATKFAWQQQIYLRN